MPKPFVLLRFPVLDGFSLTVQLLKDINPVGTAGQRTAALNLGSTFLADAVQRRQQVFGGTTQNAVVDVFFNDDVARPLDNAHLVADFQANLSMASLGTSKMPFSLTLAIMFNSLITVPPFSCQ